MNRLASVRCVAVAVALALLGFVAWSMLHEDAGPLVVVDETAIPSVPRAAPGGLARPEDGREKEVADATERTTVEPGHPVVRRLVVRVLRDGVTGIPGVPILVAKSGQGVVGFGMTDSRGAWDMVPEGEGMFFAETTCGDGAVEVRGAGEFVISIVAGELQTLCGTVVDDQGRLVPDADVMMGPNDAGSGMQRVAGTDAMGSFCVLVARAGCVLMARRKGRVDGPMVEAAEGAVLRLGDLASECSLCIVDDQGAPVRATVLVGRSAALRVWNPETGAQENWPMGREWRTGEDGCVLVDGLSGFNRELQVLPDSEKLARWRGVWQGGASQQVAVGRSGSLSGVVWSATGNPVPGARVAVGDRRDWRRAVALADAEGRFALPNREAGAVALTASHEEHGSGDVEIPAGGGSAQRVAVVLGERRKVQLTGSDGAPIADALVRLTSKGRQMVQVANGSGEVLVPSAWWADLSVEWQATDGNWRKTEAVTASGALLVVRDVGRK